ncbi:MAG: hypothetical protein B6D40_02175 [Anaerolineae bacterium UTCFX3]|jgi:hypothetical protein|nr:MAG: hypothetical protein B6D40_02175 [Anaerolineae bacterium UTCFX3]
MKIQVAKMIFPALALMLLINGCGTSQISSTLPTETPTLTPTTTPTNTAVPTFTPTFTPTPIPVSIESAIERGTFSEIRSIGKGVISKSIFSPDGSLFIAVNSRGIYIYETKYWQETRFIPARQQLIPSIFPLMGSYLRQATLLEVLPSGIQKHGMRY